MHPTKSETLQEQSIGNLVVKNVPHIPPALIEQLRQYQNTRSAILADWDSEEKGIYIITRFANNNQVHHVRAAAAARHQITFFDEPIASLQTCPNPDFDGFLFTKDTGGNEVYQSIYITVPVIPPLCCLMEFRATTTPNGTNRVQKFCSNPMAIHKPIPIFIA